MKIPNRIIKAAQDRKHLGGTLEMIGRYRGHEVYTYKYTEPMTIGMPELYIWDGVFAKTINGEEALEIMASLI